MRTMLVATVLCTLCSAAHAVAQGGSSYSTSPSERTGTVSGRVVTGDTNQPARFARVTLQAVPDPPKPSAATAQTPASPSSAPTIGTTTDTALDGSFTLAHVKPGAYYVVVEKEGYINPRAMFTQKEIDNPTPQIRAIIEAALPRVQIEADHTERADVRLERGAAVSGTVLYDDGSPAGELSVKLLHKDESGKWIALPPSRKFGAGLSTDDRGHFRIASLLPDEYLLEVDMNLSDSKTSVSNNNGRQMQFVMASFRFSLPFYGNGTPHQDQAATIKLRAGDELSGQDVTLPISKLHRLTGRVAAGPDSHLVNAASISLVMRETDKSLATSTISREDGLFHFEFVPDGDYILRVTNARDIVWEQAPPSRDQGPTPFPPQDVERTLQAYGSGEQPLVLQGDKLGVTITLPPDAAKTPIKPKLSKPE